MGDSYKIIRFYADDRKDAEVIRTGLSLSEAQAWCNDEETSSRTARHTEGVLRTALDGEWFDGYAREDS